VTGISNYSRIVFAAALPSHQQIEAFLQRNFVWFFLLPFAWMLITFGWRYYRYKRRGDVFPEVAPGQFRFHERRASGHSKKTLFSRLGGARNCLHVSVTDTEVWIRMPFPLNVLAENFDLEHRISRDAITNVEVVPIRTQQSVLLEYRDKQGRGHRLSLTLRDREAFLEAVKRGGGMGNSPDCPA